VVGDRRQSGGAGRAVAGGGTLAEAENLAP
jgi:hypothetical protein